MKRLLALAALAPLSTAHASTPVLGRWLTDDGTAIVRIGACGRTLCGEIEKVLDPEAPAKDINNPDPARRARPLAGTMVLSGFTGSGPAWAGGEAYDPKAGKAYRGQLQLLGDGRLKVTGCVLMVCRSRYWTRAK